jgi:tetratricopeptide (TPR) repeat protein
LLVVFLASLPAWAQLDRALELQRQGHAQQALTIFEREIPSLRANADQTRLAQALAAAAEACLASGKYQPASEYSKEALRLHQALRDASAQARDWNALGLADMYLGNYAESLPEFGQALTLDRRTADREGEIARLNNLGNVYYFQGRYLDALQSFSAALEKVNASVREEWNPRRRQITIANLATVYQRLGDEQKALALYSEFGANTSSVRPNEAANDAERRSAVSPSGRSIQGVGDVPFRAKAVRNGPTPRCRDRSLA